jgi:acyl carrier protein
LIDPTAGLTLLFNLLKKKSPDRAQVIVFPVDLKKFAPTEGRQLPLFADWVALATDAVSMAGRSDTSKRFQIPSQGKPDEVRVQLNQHVREQVAQTLGNTRVEEIDIDQPLMDLGVDSLLAVELRNRLQKSLAIEKTLPVTLIFDFPTIQDLSEYLGSELLHLWEKTQPVAELQKASEENG